MKSLIRQINNIRIYIALQSGRYQCVAPDGRVLEEFRSLLKAEHWARGTKDFVRRR